jgi:3-hydroxyisobutyrate dehydrogenase
MERLGVLGAGRMGLPIVARLTAAGHRVTVFDVDEERMRLAAELGAATAISAEALAGKADVLISVLPGPLELHAAMTGSGGALPRMRPGSCWLDFTSTSPDVAAHIAARASEGDVLAVGAPMAGNPRDADGGTLGFYIGGSRTAIDRVMPLLHVLGDPSRLKIMGSKVADGYVTKLLANTLWFGQAIAVTEALLLGQAAGLDLRTLRSTLESSPGGSSFLTHHVDALLAGDCLTTFGIDRVVEELDTVVRLAEDAGTPHDLTTLVAHLHRQALDEFGPVDGELLAARLLELRAGRTLRT